MSWKKPQLMQELGIVKESCCELWATEEAELCLLGLKRVHS